MWYNLGLFGRIGPKKSKTAKNVQFRSIWSNVVQFRSIWSNWTLNWTVRARLLPGSLATAGDLGWAGAGLGEDQKNQKNQKIKNNEKGTI